MIDFIRIIKRKGYPFMKKSDVREFFDRLAAGWDAGLVRNEDVIRRILDNAHVTEGADVLDVACGTGVLFPDYLGRNVRSLTAIDLSPAMADIAREKFPGVTVLCGDVEEWPFTEQFDTVMVYNAFPHFPDPAALIKRLAELTRPGGYLSVAHGMSREKIIGHHSGSASSVSRDLPDLDSMVSLFEPYFEVTAAVSDDSMYQVAGRRI